MSLEFPLLYDDELLMSGCARYYDRQGYASPLDAAFDLFGREAIAVIANLPRGIGSLAEQLPKGYPATVGDLLQKHTAFPYYAPFLPPQHVQALSNVMLDATHSERGGSTLGSMSGRLYAHSRVLRYCPACVSDDRTQTHGRSVTGAASISFQVSWYAQNIRLGLKRAMSPVGEQQKPGYQPSEPD